MKSKREQGFAVIVTLLVMVAIAVLAFGTLFTTMVDRKVSANQQGATQAYYVAQAGLQQYKSLLFDALVGYYQANPDGDWCEVRREIDTVGTGDFMLERVNADDPYLTTQAPIAFSGGEYRIRLYDNANYFVLESIGWMGNSRSTVRLVATAGSGPASAWDNAIFATGRDPGTQAINGNVSVYGSTHIVNGELALDTDLALEGTAGVYNNYLGTQVNNSDISLFMDRVVNASSGRYTLASNLPDLCAKVKIEQGDLILHGSGQVGAEVEDIYSVHLGDGVTRRKNGELITTTNRYDDTSPLYLRYPEEDTGPNSGYEGYDVPFPQIDATYPADRGFEVTPENEECAWLFDADGTFTLPPAVEPDVAHTCNADGDDWIAWTPGTPPSFEIHGVINTGSANVVLNGSSSTGGPGPLLYEGLGVLRVGQCLDDEPVLGDECGSADDTVTTTLTGSIEPLNGGFPETNALGIVSSGDVAISNQPVADNEVAAVLVYSSHEIAMDKQTLVAGAIVGAAFDMGNQVPKIAYHPAIREMAGTLCMPGSYDVEDGCEFATGPLGGGGADKAPLSQVSYERR